MEPWLPVPAEHAANAVDVNEANPNSVLHFYRRFMAWRKTQRSLITGDIRFFDAPEPVLALLRTPVPGEPASSVLAVFNLGDQPVSFALASAPATRALQGSGFDAARQGSREGAQLQLPPYGAYFGEVLA